MPKKRRSTDANDDDYTNGGSDTVHAKERNNKRVRLEPVRETALHDLPIEMLEHIIVKVVAMEVEKMKLDKSEWKEAAEVVINRLRTVCSHWSNICATKYFRNEVHRILDDTEQSTTRLEIVHQSSVDMEDCVALGRTMFALGHRRGGGQFIMVIDRSRLDEAQRIHELPALIRPVNLITCSVSNCVYLLYAKDSFFYVLRLSNAANFQGELTTVVSDLNLSYDASMSVTDSGNLFILSKHAPTTMSIYDPNGLKLRYFNLYPIWNEFREVFDSLPISESRALIATSMGYRQSVDLRIYSFAAELIYSYMSTLRSCVAIARADSRGRILVISHDRRLELLDSRLDPVAFMLPPQLMSGPSILDARMAYNKERGEVILSVKYCNEPNKLMILNFIEELK